MTLSSIIQSKWFKLAGVVVIWRIALLLLFLFAAHKIPFNPNFTAPVLQGPEILKPTVQWDSLSYYHIVLDGYPTAATGAKVAFFPLFPLLVWLGTKVGLPILVAGLVINMLAVYMACVYLYKLALSYFKKDILAKRVVLLFLFSPVAYFLAAFYTEALFCALVFGAIWYARQSKWLLACLLTGLATATRLPGVILIAVIGFEYLSQRRFQIKKIGWDILWFILTPLGLASYILYLKHHTGDPLAFMHVTKLYWSYHVFTPNIPGTVYNELHFIKNIVRHPKAQDTQLFFDRMLPFGAWLSTLAITVWAYIKKLPISYVVLGLGSLILFGINGNFVSVHRYLIAFFPIYFFIVYYTKKESYYSLALALSASSMAFLLTSFASGYWTG